jgi:hypothetical protein
MGYREHTDREPTYDGRMHAPYPRVVVLSVQCERC